MSSKICPKFLCPFLEGHQFFMAFQYLINLNGHSLYVIPILRTRLLSEIMKQLYTIILVCSVDIFVNSINYINPAIKLSNHFISLVIQILY